MIKKLAIVRNKLSIWNSHRDIEYIKDKPQHTNSEQLLKTETFPAEPKLTPHSSLNSVSASQRGRRISDDFDIVISAETLRNRTKQNSKEFFHTQSLVAQDNESEYKHQDTNIVNKYVDETGFQPIPEVS